MSASFDLDAPDHFTAGAVGAPGERVFYIQGRQGGKLVTLKSEKEQVRVLATYLSQMLDKLPTASEPARNATLAPWPYFKALSIRLRTARASASGRQACWTPYSPANVAAAPRSEKSRHSLSNRALKSTD